MSETKFRVAIIGAGIGGLTLALSLHKFCDNIDVDIYESTAEFTEVGAGVGMWPRVWEVLQSLGLEDDLLGISNMKGQSPFSYSFEYRKSDQREGQSFHVCAESVRFASFHRAHFQDVLCKHIPKSYKVHFLKRLVSYAESENGRTRLRFADDSKATCDLLVGCDGIKSTVRNVLYRSLADRAEQSGDSATAADLLTRTRPVWTGRTVYRSLLSRGALEAKHPEHPSLNRPLMYFGKNRHIVTYPVSQGQKINVGAFVLNPALQGAIYDGPWVRKASKDEFVEAYSKFELQIKDMLNCLEDVSVWAVHILPPLPTHVGDKVALVGDAAHAMVPFQGSGAGQAMEDAFVLGAILAHPRVTRDTLHEALQVYDAIRRPFSQKVAELSRVTGDYYDLRGPGLTELTAEASSACVLSAAELAGVGKRVEDMFDWVKSTSLLDDRDRALEELESALGAGSTTSSKL